MAADKAVAKQIIDAVGGADNVSTLGHCMTRLRFRLKNPQKADDAAAKKISVVKGVARSGDELHLILGTGIVDEYCDLILSEYSFGGADYSGVVEEEDLENGGKKKNPVLRALSNGMAILSGSIGAWLGCIMGSLMISAILSLLTSIGVLSTDNGTYQFFSIVSGACLYFFPVLIGYSAAEKMQTNKYMGALLGAIMIYPSLTSAIEAGTVNIFGLSIMNFSYTSTIIPVILAVWLLKYVEKLAKKICPAVISIFGVTLIELVICVPLIFLIVGPVGAVITNGISALVMWIYNNAGMFAVAVAGALLPLAVMAGVHLGLFPIATVMISDVGYDPIIHPALMVYNMSIAGSSFAYGLRNKDVDKRSLGISSGVSGILGISEAGLFGVVLTNRRVLVTTEISILISGIITGLVGYKVYVPLSQSVFSIPAAAHGDFNIYACIISLLSGLVISFIVTYFFGFSKEELAQMKEEKEAEKAIANLPAIEVSDSAVVAPADGEIIDIKNVSDPVFADETLGKSIAFRYTGDKVTLCAPANGTLSLLFPTGHAFGVTTANGTELLVHCGINTVNAEGDGFRVLGKKIGDPVKAGDPIVEVNLKKLRESYDMSTILIVTDGGDDNTQFAMPGNVQRGQSILAQA